MTNNKHQIVIAYTQTLCSEGLGSLLENSRDFVIQGLVPIIYLENYLKSRNSVDIIIIELILPNCRNIDLIINLKRQFPQIRVMIISLQPSPNLSSKLIKSGIDAYILKECCSKTDLFAALTNMVNDKNYFCSEITKSILSASVYSSKKPEVALTQRETEVLSLLVAGNTNTQIAKELRLSENTVKTHRKNILGKFGVNNLFGMVRYACRARLMNYDSDGFCHGCPSHI